MTTRGTLASVYAGSPKLIVWDPTDSILNAFSESVPCNVFVARKADGGSVVITAADGEFALTAPPAGPTVVVAANDDACASLCDLWRGAKLATPAVVSLGGDDAAALQAARVAVAEALAAEALKAHAAVSVEATSLDRQIVALREQLEDARNKWQDCSEVLRTVTRGLAVLGYSTRASSGNRVLTPGETVSQILPFSGLYCKAVAFQITKAATGAGNIECQLLASEDDAVLATWESIERDRDGWVTLEIPENIPWRYRNLRLVIKWSGSDDGGPQIAIAKAAGMDRYFLHVDAVPQAGERLAMRVWTGHPYATAHAGGEPPRKLRPTKPAGDYGVLIGPDVLRAHTKMVDRSLGDWPWVEVDDASIMIHPTPAGPSIVSVRMRAPMPIKGVQLTCESPNGSAVPIDFLAAVYPADFKFSLDEFAPDPLPRDAAVAIEGWHTVKPRTVLPLMMDFKQQRDPLQLVLATRVEGSRVDHAHAWFRELRMRCVVR